ncbi:MAG TPA: GIY-YIG nuclease family protein [Terriglobales bacterium]|nr:GIY-YIG nuclease family protein [Terriglobales bacterium]
MNNSIHEWQADPDKKKAAVQKMLQTKERRRLAKLEQNRRDAQERRDLESGIAALRQEYESMRATILASRAALSLSGDRLFTEEEIVAASVPTYKITGIYFLIQKGKVVYVGQSVSIATRVEQHKDKSFDAVSVIPCKLAHLDALESLYIHMLRPKYNGHAKSLCAPLNLNQVLSAALPAFQIEELSSSQ